MGSINLAIAEKMLPLRQRFVGYRVYDQLDKEFSRLLGKKQSELNCNIVAECRGIALIGASG